MVTLLAAASSLALVTQADGATAAAYTADWQMNETSGSTMLDSSGNGLNGHIGSQVDLGQRTPDGGFAYGFSGDSSITTDERLVTVPDSSLLDPGAAPYAVTIRLRTAASDTNVLQKGQSGQTGGYWKLEVHQGWPVCHFRDANGNTKAIGFVNSTNPDARVDDNTWHTLRCERTSTGVRMTIDYGSPTAMSRTINGTIGTINNTRPLSIGGKLDCDGVKVGCDYFSGAIDWVHIERP
jgi:hypothetical protein